MLDYDINRWEDDGGVMPTLSKEQWIKLNDIAFVYCGKTVDVYGTPNWNKIDSFSTYNDDGKFVNSEQDLEAAAMWWMYDNKAL